jgi:hypothetical protein
MWLALLSFEWLNLGGKYPSVQSRNKGGEGGALAPGAVHVGAQN